MSLFRRACHQALDIVFDAWEDDKKAKSAPRPPRLREPLPMPPGVTSEDVARVERKMQANGFRRAS